MKTFPSIQAMAMHGCMLVLVCAFPLASLRAQVDTTAADAGIDEPGDPQEDLEVPNSVRNTTGGADFSDVLKRLEKLEAAEEDDKPDAVMLSIGGDFDFLEKEAVNGLYFDLNFYTPHVLVSKHRFLSGLQIEGRASQGALAKGVFFQGEDTNMVAMATFRDQAVGLDSTRYIAERFRLSRSFVPKYAFMQVDALWKLNDDKPDKDEFGKKRDEYRSSFSLMLPFIEYYVLALQTTTKPRLLSRDTLVYPNDTTLITAPFRFLQDGVEVAETRRTIYTNWGLGMHYRYSSARTLMVIRGVVGYSVQFQGVHPYFYMANFEYTSVKQGIKFGGEVRGTFGTELPLGSTSLSGPTAHFYIAKTFGGSSIAKFITQ